MKTLQISDTFTLPLEAVTETFLDLGQRGAGKTNTAAVIAEELFAHGAPFAVLTPIDVWWGLKSSADGKGPGLPIYIFGGQHADLPLAPTAGRLMADVLIEQRISCVICTQGFSGKERAAFTTDFAERLLDKNREPLHLIVEEADAFIPQRPFPGEERMLGAMDRLIRWGRSPSAIGGTFISQRSAKINKDITTQCSVLVAHRTMAPQDVEAIKEWFKYHPDTEKQKQLLAEIASLPKGMVFIYSPAWLEHFGKCQIRRRHTFDSAATPKLGARLIEPKTAVVDLKVLEAKMAATIEKVKAEDPKELRKQIVSLKTQIAAMEKLKPAPLPPERVEVSILTDEDLKNFEGLAGVVALFATDLMSMKGILDEVRQLCEKASRIQPNEKLRSAPIHSGKQPLPSAKKPERLYRDTQSHSHPNGNAQLGNSGLRRILTALAQYPQGRSSRQVGILAGLSSKSGSFNTYLAKGRTSGWITGERALLQITDLGMTALGNDWEPLPQGKELLSYWTNELGAGGGASRILRILAERYPQTLSKEEVGEAAGLSHSSGSFNTYLSKLRTLELVEGRGELKASDTLFE